MSVPSLSRTPWAVGEAEAAEIARAATADALSAVAEEKAAAAAAAAAAVAVAADQQDPDAEGSGEGEGLTGTSGGDDGNNRKNAYSVEAGSLMSASDQESVRAWLKRGVTVKKWTAGGSGTRKRKLWLESVDPALSLGIVGGAGGGSKGAAEEQEMPWAAWAQESMTNGAGVGGVQEPWAGEDGAWVLVLQSDKGKDTAHRLCNLRAVAEDAADKSVTLSFEGDGDEAEGKMKLSFQTDQPVVLFFRQV